MGWLGHEVVHACLVGAIDESLLLVRAQAANVGALVEVFRVVASLDHVLDNVLRRLQSIHDRHAVVHEDQPIGLELPPRINVYVALLYHFDRLDPTQGNIRLDPHVRQDHSQRVQQEHLIVCYQDQRAFLLG